MSNLPKVIFDTNFLSDKQPRNFFGNRVELKKFERVAEIIMPDMVLGEVENQIRRNLENKKKSFLENPFHWLKNLDEDETKNFDTESHILELKKSEDVKFTEIKITDFSVLEKMKDLALKKQAPFEAGDNTDKGFKDTYIYFSILEFLQNTLDKEIFVCTNDNRLKEALMKFPSINLIKDYDEFIKKSISVIENDEFISRINEGVIRQLNEERLEVLSKKIESKDFIDYWINKDDNRIFHIKDNGRDLLIEMDSGEVLNINEGVGYKKLDLSGVESFESAHQIIDIFNDVSNFLTHEEIINILDAYRNRSQVKGTLGFRRSSGFLRELYDGKKDILEEGIKKDIEKMLK